MKIRFKDDFKSDQVETQVGDQRFVFERKNEPFEVADEVGAYCLRLPYFTEVQTESVAVAISAEMPEVAPRKK